jgi:hypothetical protein
LDITQIIALTMGVAWASGINLYAAVFMLGYLGGNGYIDLPPGLEVLTHPVVLFASGFMYCVEFFADKTPGVDTLWDGVHTFIRIPAGAVLAMGAVGTTEPAIAFAALLVGGALTAGTHATKAGGRVLINTSPEPVSNWTASVGEDVLVIAGLWTALYHPWLFLVLLILLILLMAWLLPKIWRGIVKVFSTLRGLLTGRSARPDEPLPPAPGSDDR